MVADQYIDAAESRDSRGNQFFCCFGAIQVRLYGTAFFRAAFFGQCICRIFGALIAENYIRARLHEHTDSRSSNAA